MHDRRRDELEPLPPRFHLAAAGFLEREGDARGALDLYERVARHWPDDPASLRALLELDAGRRVTQGSAVRTGPRPSGPGAARPAPRR